MVSETARQRLRRGVNNVWGEDMTLYAAEKASRVPRETIRRFRLGLNDGIHEKTFRKLVDWVERESEGRIRAESILVGGPDFRGEDLRGEKFEGVDLEDADFTGANCEDAVFSDVNLENARMDLVNFRGATLSKIRGDGVMARGCNFRRTGFYDVRNYVWKMNGAETWDGSRWNNVYVGAEMHGADLSKVAEFKNVQWWRGGGAARGLVLPDDLDLEEIESGCDCHPFVARVVTTVFPNDMVMTQFAEFVVSRLFFACWESAVRRIKTLWPNRMKDFETAFSRYPRMDILDRFRWGEALEACDSLEAYKELLDHPLYPKFPNVLDVKIKEIERTGRIAK